MISLKQQIINLFYRCIIKPLNVLDGRSRIKRLLVVEGGYILAKYTKSMSFMTSELKTSLGVANITTCTNGPITSKKIILYIHGGGFSTGGAKSHQHMAARLAGKIGGTAFLPHYPLAPEHPFPQSIHFIHEIYRTLIVNGHQASDIILAGDSAGGNLCAALTQMLEKNVEPLPSGIILFSPALDLTYSNPTHNTNKSSELMLSKKLLAGIRKIYIRDKNPLDPLSSPLFAEYKNPPPFLIFASECEVFLGDAIEFAAKLKKAGHKVTLITEKGLPHVWQFLWGHSREADKSLAQCEEFMAQL